MQQVYFELQYPTLFSGRETSSAVDEATIIAEFEKKKVQLDQKAFMDKLDEKDFEREAVRQLREVDSYERIHSFLKDGEIKSISLVCLGVVKQECNANGIAAAKRKNIDCIRGQVLELAQTLKRRLVDHNEQASYEATMKAARDNHSKEWPAHIVKEADNLN